MNTYKWIITASFCSFMLLNACSLHYVVNKSKSKQNLIIATSFSDSLYPLDDVLKKLIPRNGVSNIVVGNNEDTTIVSFDLQPAKNINIGSLIHNCADTSGVNLNWLLIVRNGEKEKIDTLLYQRGEKKIVNKGTVHWLGLWNKYYYGFR
jgi:hypothetical protein